jgi:hypothetical protein
MRYPLFPAFFSEHESELKFLQCYLFFETNLAFNSVNEILLCWRGPAASYCHATLIALGDRPVP